MIVAEILRALVWDRAADWDPVGLQLGDPQATADSVGVCHEVTDRVVEESRGLDLLITYHPLLFKPTTHLLVGKGPEEKALRLIKQGVNLAVAHTAWDVFPGGTADALAQAVGLGRFTSFGLLAPGSRKKLVTFVPANAVEAVTTALVEAGAGAIGKYRGCSFRSEGIGGFLPEVGASPSIGRIGEREEVAEVRLEMLVTASEAGRAVAALVAAHPYEEPAYDLIEAISNAGFIGRVGENRASWTELMERLRAQFGNELRVGSRPDQRAQRVAVLPGSGGSFVSEAAGSGADVFITGDLSHHQMVAALDRGMAAVDIGHAASEQPGVKALLDHVGKMVPDVIDLTYDPTPWRT